jgi:aspartate carbamoyltransferase catalytic subunit
VSCGRDAEVVDGNRSMILDQVEAGVAVRMAILWRLAAESHESPPA